MHKRTFASCSLEIKAISLQDKSPQKKDSSLVCFISEYVFCLSLLYPSPPTAASLGIKFIETSAKNSSNIDSSFENMALDVLKKISTLKNQQETDKKRLRPGNNLTEEKTTTSNSCCWSDKLLPLILKSMCFAVFFVSTYF